MVKEFYITVQGRAGNKERQQNKPTKRETEEHMGGGSKGSVGRDVEGG